MKTRIVDRLKSIPIPEGLSRENVSQFLSQALLGEVRWPPSQIREIRTNLESKELEVLVNEGKITLALIKPELASAVPQDSDKPVSDSEIVEQIRDNIRVPLQEFFSISLVLTDEMVEEWYEGMAKQRQIGVPPFDENRYGQHHESRWDEYKSLMLRGSVTFLLLYSEDGKAVEHWRQQMGNHWNVDKVREMFPDSLRAKLAKDNHNNLLHGSDSPESALREIHLLSNYLGQLAVNKE